MTISDNALTLINNVQSMAAVGNVNLRATIYELREMLDVVHKLTAEDFDASIPAVDISDIPGLIAEVEGYLQGVLDDSQSITSMISNGSQQAVDAIEALMASLVPGEVNTLLTDRQVSFASDVMTAERSLSESERKRAEVSVLANASALGFASPPGFAVGAIADIRAKESEIMGRRAAELRQQEQEQNARLFLDRLEKQYAMQEQLIRAWVQSYELTAKLIGQIIADYEKSPLLDAQVAAETASSLTGAYAGLNNAAIQLTRAAGISYKAQLMPHKLQVLEDQLQGFAYEKGMKLTFSERGKIASLLSGALRDAGQIAGSCLAATSAHGNFVERSFQ